MSPEILDLNQLQAFLENPEAAFPWLKKQGFYDVEGAYADLVRINRHGVPLDLMVEICRQIQEAMPAISDPNMALNNLERFIGAARNPMSMAALFERDLQALPNLLSLFSTSQYLSDVLVQDHHSYDVLRMTEGQPVSREVLLDEIMSDVRLLKTSAEVMASLRRYKRRETLRIAYGDIVRGQPVSLVSRQISFLADAIVEAALDYARRTMEEKYGVPLGHDGKPVRFVVLSLGKLGGVELNYSSDIDLILMYDQTGQTNARRGIDNQEFFSRVTREMVRLLTEPTELGTTYRVDLRLRPEGSRGPVCMSLEAMLTYYDMKGRTWERQAFVKARAMAGDLEFGVDFLKMLEPWTYRQYLSIDDITGIQSLKRRIEQRTIREGGDQRNVKTGYGGIRDIEFVIQFLQLLNGGSKKSLRTGTTLDAISRLEKSGCLTHQERTILAENYCFLRKIEHRLQIMFDLQTHMIPEAESEQAKVAIRMGYVGTPHQSALRAFKADLKHRTELNRKILDHLLHDSFTGESESAPEIDLVNDPLPTEAYIEEVLEKFGFKDIPAAYENLMALATEKLRFLSTRRCRLFLAAIAPQLLKAIALSPYPDVTLMNLSRVSDSLGGKAALWELFSVHPPTLKLYVILCSSCPYLASILTSNPGLIDELLDSLMVEKLPTKEMLEETLAELCHGAEDLDPILHSFKHAQHLRIGVRDIVGKDDVYDTHQSLADVAETVLNQIVRTEFSKLVKKMGQPMIGPVTISDEDPIRKQRYERFFERIDQPCEFIILAMGKLGGREPNYHSDLDLVFLYESDGYTIHPRHGRAGGTTNTHFFSQLGQKVMKVANRIGPYGRLYEVDPRLRPTGKSGSLAVPLDKIARYFAEGNGHLWERQALCKARVIFGSDKAKEMTMENVAEAAFGPAWKPEYAAEIRKMRMKLEETASIHNLKRGFGGTVDIEFLVQMLELKYGPTDPEVRVSGTRDALNMLEKKGYLTSEDAEAFRNNYQFQRSIESRIRLMDSSGRHEFPDDKQEQKKLAFLLRRDDIERIAKDVIDTFADNRRRFNRIFDAMQ